jgi:hypothetical protein
VQDRLGTGAEFEGSVDTDPKLRGPAVPGAAATAPGIAPAGTDVVAFLGRCLKGPVNEPVAVRSFTEFEQVFGSVAPSFTLPHAIEQFFEQGGAHALVVRVASGGAPPTIDLRAGDDTLVLQGICPGTREYLRVAVDYDGISQQDGDLFNLVVQRVRAPGSELVETQETFRRLSVLSGSAREIGRVLTGSRLVRLHGRLPRQRPDITLRRDSRTLAGWVDCNRDGDDGLPLSDYDIIGSESAYSGLFALVGGPQFSFLYVPPLAPDRDVGVSALFVAARFCRLAHAMLVVDPPLAWKDAEDALAGMRGWPFKSPDALMCFPPVYAMDRHSGRLVRHAPGAAAVGMLVRGEGQGATPPWELHEMPLLRPSVQPAVPVDDSQRDRLARMGVNVLAATRSAARASPPLRTLAGDRSAPPEAGDLAQRRLAQFIGETIERGTRWVTVEGNTERSRERVSRQVERFLAQLGVSGALAGTERNRHYFVLCDERLNGPAQQASGEFRFIYGFESRDTGRRQSVLVVHRPAGSESRPVNVNALAALELRQEPP